MKTVVYKKSKRGISIIEIVIGSAIITVGILGLINAYSTYITYGLANDKNAQAIHLTESGLEAVSYLRDSGWNANIKNLSTTTTYYLYWNGSKWLSTTTPQYTDTIFLRKFTITDVFRNSSDKIVASGAGTTYDANTKQVTVTLQYIQGHATTTKTAALYITNLYGN
jgi:hypothetical protein